ncbi:unnamed protein product [Protopolystoma xenopodis]|uniref:Uncharacterized protein n=1 Tax=Protopolystoma xenopodis TaxID=117903 RepID=A0A448WTR1_9PLAT|nr:unnamed protein product [Protopolystoma xenopodis]
MTDSKLLISHKDVPKNRWHPPVPIPPEERGHGVNRWDYYVCTKLGPGQTTWVRLPSLRPEHIVKARGIRRLFTGRLNSPVPGGLAGEFPGVEAHLLRAQIARITAASWIAPAGMFEVDEEAELEEGVSRNL